MNKALKDFKVVEAEFAEPEPIVETTESAETCDEVGSFFPDDDPAPTPSEPEATEATNVTVQDAQAPDFDGFVSYPASEVDEILRL